MRSYPRHVLLPGDPGGSASTQKPRHLSGRRWGRPIRLALLTLAALLLVGAAPGGPVRVPGLAAQNTDVVAIPSYAAPAAQPRISRERDWSPPPPVSHPVIVRLTKPAPPAPKPWLPTGTGMWIHEWPKTMNGNARKIVQRAKAYGITTIYLRTGTKKGGFDSAHILRVLLPMTRGTNIKIVAWDFPTLSHPRMDARRLAAAARYRAPGRGSPQVAAVAPDIETGAEGTHSTQAAVSLYLRTLRQLLPQTPILTTVPWPSEQRIGRFPYGTVAAHSNAIMPMAYWYNRSAAGVTSFSIRWLRRYGKPVLPVGQGFDSQVDAAYLPHSHQWTEVSAFFKAAIQEHVTALSLWDWQTAGPQQWLAIARYRAHFAPPRPKPKPKPHAVVHRPVPQPARPAAVVTLRPIV
jgi:hypothetical protein